MRKVKSAKPRLPVSVCISALIGLSTFLLPVQNATAQSGCTPSVGDAPTFLEDRAHVGDTVHITRVDLVVGTNTCQLANGTNWLIYPDGTIAVVAAGYSTIFGNAQTISCPGGANCVPFTQTYVIQASDVNRTLTFTRPRSGDPASSPGTPNTISILAATEADAILELPGTFGTGSGNKRIAILNPCISITKECDYPPGTNCFPYGAPIKFKGTVSNCSPSLDTPLSGITVTDTPSGPVSSNSPITFAATTSRGRPFDGSLTNGESVAYSGFYVPAGTGAALCGPFTDTVIASGTDNATAPLQKTVTATNTATCDVCNNPAIAVTKLCPPGPVAPGGILTFSGTVSNAGNVPLIDVTVVNDRVLTNGGTLVASYPLLTNGESRVFSGSYLVPTNLCSITDTLIARGTNICDAVGVAATNSATCQVTNTPALRLTKACPPTPPAPGSPLSFTGTITNIGDIAITNIALTDTATTNGVFYAGPSVTPSLIARLEPGQGASFSGSYPVPTNVCSISDTVTASGADVCGDRVSTNINATCAVTNTPRLALTKACPANPPAPGQTLVYTGTVTNTGNIAVTNIVLSDRIFGTNTAAPTPSLIPRLEPGQGTAFTGGYTVPTNYCSITDTLTASGTDVCGDPVSTNVSQTCSITNTPRLVLTKACPVTPPAPGQNLVFTGTVTNVGNIALTNVVIVNNEPTNNAPVFTISRLEPGQGAVFTGRYLVPTNACSLTDTLTATGTSVCGAVVSTNATQTCPVVTTPRLVVTKACPTNLAAPGGTAVFSGTVSNAGNVTLTNVIVVNNRPTNSTPVIGPITLAPGQSTNFTGSEVVPANCCAYFDTLTATGTSICGSNAVATATAVCPTLTTPRISVTKNCPPNPVPLGQPLIFSGIVSNSGNVTLTNVTVVNSLPADNTPVFGPVTLAPGEIASFTGSYVVPTNICVTNMSDTVTARGFSICTGSNAVATATAVCPVIITPKLSVTKKCPPNPVAPGQPFNYSGTVSNAGNITLTNVTVVNDRPTNNTPVVSIPILVPGQTVDFTASYIAPYDCCGPCVDTLTAQGVEICTGSNVVATASAACPRITTPNIAVTRDCPLDPAQQGELTFFTGTVANSGNATLNYVSVIDDLAGTVLDNIALAPSEAVGYWGMYVPTNCGPRVACGVTASGADICTGNVVSNRLMVICSVICPAIQPVTIFNPAFGGGAFTFSFATELNRAYTVEFTDSLVPADWQMLTNFPGTGAIVTIPDAATNAQRFYRVLIQ